MTKNKIIQDELISIISFLSLKEREDRLGQEERLVYVIKTKSGESFITESSFADKKVGDEILLFVNEEKEHGYRKAVLIEDIETADSLYKCSKICSFVKRFIWFITGWSAMAFIQDIMKEGATIQVILMYVLILAGILCINSSFYDKRTALDGSDQRKLSRFIDFLRNKKDKADDLKNEEKVKQEASYVKK